MKELAERACTVILDTQEVTDSSSVEPTTSHRSASSLQQPLTGCRNAALEPTQSNRNDVSTSDTDGDREKRPVQECPTDGGASVRGERCGIRISSRQEDFGCGGSASLLRPAARRPRDRQAPRLLGLGRPRKRSLCFSTQASCRQNSFCAHPIGWPDGPPPGTSLPELRPRPHP